MYIYMTFVYIYFIQNIFLFRTSANLVFANFIAQADKYFSDLQSFEFVAHARRFSHIYLFIYLWTEVL